MSLRHGMMAVREGVSFLGRGQTKAEVLKRLGGKVVAAVARRVDERGMLREGKGGGYGWRAWVCAGGGA